MLKSSFLALLIESTGVFPQQITISGALHIQHGNGKSWIFSII